MLRMIVGGFTLNGSFRLTPQDSKDTLGKGEKECELKDEEEGCDTPSPGHGMATAFRSLQQLWLSL